MWFMDCKYHGLVTHAKVAVARSGLMGTFLGRFLFKMLRCFWVWELSWKLPHPSAMALVWLG